MLKLTAENYFSQRADREYMSVSQYKDFIGSWARPGCEARAMARLDGAWEETPSAAMMVGSYVDAHFSGELKAFTEAHPEILKRDGSLKAEYIKADKMIARAELDRLFSTYMRGRPQVIMTGELFGAQWKIKIDSYHEGAAIVDLKCVQSIPREHWVRDLGYMDFVRYWGYDTQAAVYQAIVQQMTGKRLHFYIAAISKEDTPDIEVIHIPDAVLDEALGAVETALPRVLRIKRGEEEPCRCRTCDYCRETKVLDAPISLGDLAMGL